MSDQKNQSLREKVSAYFGVPMGATSYRLFLASMNVTGKITARSTLELLTIAFEKIEEMEKTKENAPFGGGGGGGASTKE